MRLDNFNTYFFFGALILVSVFAYKMFAPYLSAIFVAAIISVMLYKVYCWIVKHTNGKVFFSAVLTCFLALFIIVLPVIGVIGIVASEAVELVDNVITEGTNENRALLTLFNNIKKTPFVESLSQNPEQILASEQVRAQIKSVGQGAVTILQRTSIGVVSSIVWIFVMFFTLFYFFVDGKKIKKRVMHLSPLPDKHETLLVEKFVSMTRATLKGTVVIGFMQGLLGGLTFVLTGVASPMIWTVVMIILSIIPAVGASLVMIPVGIVMIVLGNLWQGIVILAAAFAISLLDNFLRPKLVGNDTQMHTLLVFFATLGGLSVFGLIGFIVGPIIMALFLALWEIYALEFKQQLKKYNA